MRKLVFLDIGSRGKVPDEWKSLGRFLKNGIEVHTFDLDPKSQMIEDGLFKYINHSCGLWSSVKSLDFFITGLPVMSSCYRPNEEIKYFLKRHHEKRLVWDKISVQKVSTLDLEFTPGKSCDFIKCDTQGSEYEISKGGINLLKQSCPIVALETWSEEVYESIPLDFEIKKLYYDIDYFLIYKDPSCGYWQYDTKGRFPRSQGRFMGDNLLFVPKIKLLGKLSDEDLIAKLTILSYFRFYDYCYFFLNKLGKLHLLHIIDNIYHRNENLHSDLYRKLSRILYESRRMKLLLKRFGINTTPKIT